MRRKLHAPFLLIAICLLALWSVALAPAKMHTHKIPGGLCETTGGKKIVSIPGFPGEKIDRRVLPDLKRLIKRYKLFVIDGYSRDPVHAGNGEHPMGLAADLVPDFAHGGNWHLVDKLAKKAEPHQNRPVAPYRWVGYNGDAGHGRGNHLHLSWSHSELTGHRRFPKTVISKRCPGRHKSAGHSGHNSGHNGSGDNGNGAVDNSSGGGRGGSGGHGHHGGNSGGVTPSGGGKQKGGDQSGTSKHGSGKHAGASSGGVGLRLKRSSHVKLAPPHPETAAESLR